MFDFLEFDVDLVQFKSRVYIHFHVDEKPLNVDIFLNMRSKTLETSRHKT